MRFLDKFYKYWITVKITKVQHLPKQNLIITSR